MRFLSLLAFLGFVFSLVAHLLAFWHINLIKTPLVWLLSFGLVIVLMLRLFLTRSSVRRKNGHKKIIAPPPNWLQFIILCFLVYAAVNCGLLISLREGGIAIERNGRYVLENYDGQIVRELTVEEYNRQTAYLTRALFGVWMMSYLQASVDLWYRAREQ